MNPGATTSPLRCHLSLAQYAITYHHGEKFPKILLPASPPNLKHPVHPQGALAQLVEHLHGMQGVSGSNPLRSTFFAEPRLAN